MGYPLPVSNAVIEISAGEVAQNTGSLVRKVRQKQRDCEIVRRLIGSFETRKEQIAEWRRLTGKCRRTFEHRLRDLREAG